jgi:hypothetical protein
MSRRDSEVRVRRGRIRDRGRGFSRPKSFVGQVMRAAKKAGHVGHSFGLCESLPLRSGPACCALAVAAIDLTTCGIGKFARRPVAFRPGGLAHGFGWVRLRHGMS